MTTNAIATLTNAFEKTFTTADRAANRNVVVVSWPSVPIEIIRAAGLRPFFARGSAISTPAADEHLEAGIFPSRLRSLVDAALAGRLSHAACIVIPRTSDPDYKCFLYLRQFVRLGIAPALPPTLLFDLLQSHGPDVREYNAARTRALFEELATIAGRQPSLGNLRHEIARTNAARAALRRLAAQRRGAPRIAGAEVFPLLGAFWRLAPDDYTTLAATAADEIERRSPVAGPRVLLAGAPVEGPALHAAIESRGAVVVDEVGPWGSGAAGDDAICGDDPITALSEKYRTDTIGPRTPANAMRASIASALDEVDAVVVSLPPDDTAFGWDYPALRGLLETRRIPHTCLHGDPYQPLSPSDKAHIDAVLTAAAARTAALHG
jgi:benzoyl-CoA reductase/2-hydroxyglutaryl-CoA dehydratase subunit BcrC/BadD/HgdB